MIEAEVLLGLHVSCCSVEIYLYNFSIHTITTIQSGMTVGPDGVYQPVLAVSATPAEHLFLSIFAVIILLTLSS